MIFIGLISIIVLGWLIVFNYEDDKYLDKFLDVLVENIYWGFNRDVSFVVMLLFVEVKLILFGLEEELVVLWIFRGYLLVVFVKVIYVVIYVVKRCFKLIILFKECKNWLEYRNCLYLMKILILLENEKKLYFL